jgi:uncharacterized membrane protein
MRIAADSAKRTKSRMLYNLIFASTLLSAIGSGAIGGVFFAFSTFVMKALAGLPPAQGIAAMQAINVTVLNAWFLGSFLGTGVLSVLATALSFVAWPKSAAFYVLAGCALYLLGTGLVTMLFNVPRNDAMANLDPVSPDSVKLWTNYVVGWTTWNHVRTVGALAAAVSLTIGLYLSRSSVAA